ncbi:hypothetical protein ACHAO9_009580 [Fusarium lateritium]
MRSVASLSAMRALSGIGAAFILPNAIALLTTTFPPGKARNISVGLFGAMSPIGAAGGSVFPGFFGQLLPWWWLFFFLTMLGAVIFSLFHFVVPAEGRPQDPAGKIDYIGAYFGVAGLFLFNFVWTQATIVGWERPYIYILLILCALHLVMFIVWEIKTSEPIMPMTIWNSPSFNMVIVSAFVSFMSFGMLLWYVTAWQVQIRGYSMFLNAATYAPLAVGGAGAAILSAKVIRHLAAQYILAIGSLATVVSLILIATMPEQQTYWAQAFPAMLIGSLGPDFLFTASQLIASGTVKRSQQGIAGSLIGTMRRERNRRAQKSFRLRQQISEQERKQQFEQQDDTIDQVVSIFLACIDHVMNSEWARCDSDLINKLGQSIQIMHSLLPETRDLGVDLTQGDGHPSSSTIPATIQTRTNDQEGGKGKESYLDSHVERHVNIQRHTVSMPYGTMQASLESGRQYEPVTASSGMTDKNVGFGSYIETNVTGRQWISQTSWLGNNPAPILGNPESLDSPFSLQVTMSTLKHGYDMLLSATNAAEPSIAQVFGIALQRRSREQILLHLRWLLRPGTFELDRLCKANFNSSDAAVVCNADQVAKLVRQRSIRSMGNDMIKLKGHP